MTTQKIHPRQRRTFIIILAFAAAAAIASVLFLQARVPTSDDAAPREMRATTDPIDLEFRDAAARSRSLVELRGKAVLLNLWATWCVPCREEMPTLDRLQAKLGGPDFEVVALSLDRSGPDVVTRFFAEIGIANLAIYLVDMAAVRSALGLFGLPTTLLLGRDGREVSRVVGPAEWDSPEMVASIRQQLDLPPAPPAPANLEGAE